MSVKQLLDYVSATIGRSWRPGWGLSEEETAAMAGALQEPRAIVDSVLAPYEGETDPLAMYCGNGQGHEQIKYCPSCVEEGYHSHFHTLLWIERCPFDGAELMSHSCDVGRDGPTNRVAALTEILRARWPGWPGGVPDSTVKRRHLAPLFMSFQRWVLDTNRVTRNLIEMRFAQRASIYWVDSSNCAHRVNQLRALLAPPGEILQCFSGASAASPNLLPVAAQATLEMRDLLDKYEFYELIWFYRICHNSDPAGSASRDALDTEQASIRNEQAPCRCRWGHSQNEGWRSVHPDEWPHWDLKCPHEVACDFLEAHYGDFRCGQSRRAADKEFFRYIESAEKFANAGLARQHHAPEDKLSEEIQRCVRNWQPWVEWTGPLAEAFDAVLDAGLAADVTWLHRWLVDVEKGGAPQTSPFLYPGVGIINHGSGLGILSWHEAGRE